MSASDLDRFRTLETDVVAVLEGSYFSASALRDLSATGKLGGLLVLGDSSPNIYAPGSSFSHDSRSPQGSDTPSSGVSIDGDYMWNLHASGLLLEAFDVPVSLVSKEDAAVVRSHAAANAAQGLKRHPLWVAHMESYFGKAKDTTSITCIGWKNQDGKLAPKCLPLGGQSVWGNQTRPIPNPRPGLCHLNPRLGPIRQVRWACEILVLWSWSHLRSTARAFFMRHVYFYFILFFISLFLSAAHPGFQFLYLKAAYGANDAVGSMVTVLAALDALSKHPAALAAAPKQVSVCAVI